MAGGNEMKSELNEAVPDKPVNILKEVEKDIASRKRSFLYSLIRRDQALALVEYVKANEEAVLHNNCVCVSCRRFMDAREKLGLK
jgi:hypothetical protein